MTRKSLRRRVHTRSALTSVLSAPLSPRSATVDLGQITEELGQVLGFVAELTAFTVYALSQTNRPAPLEVVTRAVALAPSETWLLALKAVQACGPGATHEDRLNVGVRVVLNAIRDGALREVRARTQQ